MSQPFLNLLARQSFPELAAAIRDAYPRIEARWMNVVQNELKPAEGMTVGQLRDDLPKVMEQVAHSVESERPEAVQRLSAISPVHGKVRFDQNFSLDDLLIEYNLLHGTTIQVLSETLRRPLGMEESMLLNAALNLVVRQATAAFVEHQTRQLKVETEAQSKYLSFLSHDLRGELNGVFLMIEVLRRELAKEPKFAESLEDLDMMRRSMSQTIGTMDRFLHAERFRKGRVQARPAPVNLAALMSEVGAQVSYHAKDKKLKLEITPCDNCRITTDRDLVMMILQNLVGNAIKYSKAGTIRVAAQSADGDGGGYILSVADEGPGIAPEKINELFATFTRGDTHGQQGSGLGLSIARQAADMIGGRLWAESQLGEGATFFLRLPPSTPAAAPTPPSARG